MSGAYALTPEHFTVVLITSWISEHQKVTFMHLISRPAQPCRHILLLVVISAHVELTVVNLGHAGFLLELVSPELTALAPITFPMVTAPRIPHMHELSPIRKLQSTEHCVGMTVSDTVR